MNIKPVVSALSLLGCLTASAAGILDFDAADMHWQNPPGPGSSYSAPQSVTDSGTQCTPAPECDDMHW